MRFRVIFQIVGFVNLIIALIMLAPLFVSLYYKDGSAKAFALSIAITAASGALLFLYGKPGGKEINHRQGFVVVALAWVAAAFFSALPFEFSGVFPTFLDCFFESVSGLTTTGASIATDIDSMPKGILFWRSLTHWFGGMGIVIMGLAVLPILGIGGMQLYKAEASGVSAEKLAPRVREMARILLEVYLIISLVLFVFLLIGGMSLYDSLVHTFGTVATGGFSNRGLSIAHYNSLFIEIVIIVFMTLGATNFGLHFRFINEGFKGLKAYYYNAEFRFYIAVMASSALLMAFNLYGTVYESFGLSLRHAAFQASSIMTTTGYASADFIYWPFFSQSVLIFLMLIGGSAGSTCGSIKCMRVLILIKLGYREMYKLIHPHAVKPVKLGGKTLSPEVINGVVGFTFLYITVFVMSSILLSWQGVDLVTSVSSVATTMGGVGPGLGATGPMANFAGLSVVSKLVLIADMLLGRLEIYTLLLLLLPAFWRG